MPFRLLLGIYLKLQAHVLEICIEYFYIPMNLQENDIRCIMVSCWEAGSCCPLFLEQFHGECVNFRVHMDRVAFSVEL